MFELSNARRATPLSDAAEPSPTVVPLPKRTGPVKLLVLQGTPFCNINCRYCYLPDRTNKGQMAIDTVRAVIDNLLESELLKGSVLVNWHAGEPLVLPVDFYAERMPLFNLLKEHGISVTHSLQTNGMLVTDAYCKLFKAFDVQVGVSIDGPAFIHDAQRQLRNGRGTHARVLAGVKKLQEHNIPFNAICVLSDLSVRHPDAIYRFFKESGFRAVAFNIEEIEGANRSSSIENTGFDERFRHFFEHLWELVEADQKIVRIREFDDAEGRILDPFPRRNSQTDPLINLTVAYNGDFSTFCPELLGNSSMQHPDFMFGNVHQHRLRDIVHSAKFLRIYSEIAHGVEACRERCDYFEVCGGGNPSNKISENGSFETTETRNCRNRIQTMCDLVISKIEQRL